MESKQNFKIRWDKNEKIVKAQSFTTQAGIPGSGYWMGLPNNKNFETTETLGLNLIKNLAQQIEGEVIYEQTDWTIFKIVFKGYEFGKKKYKNN
jgi:hypothetical protein